MRKCRKKSVCLMADNECEKQMAEDFFGILLYNGYEAKKLPFEVDGMTYAVIEWEEKE